MKAASTPFKKKKKQSGVWLTLLPLYLFTLVFVAGPSYSASRRAPRYGVW